MPPPGAVDGGWEGQLVTFPSPPGRPFLTLTPSISAVTSSSMAKARSMKLASTIVPFVPEPAPLMVVVPDPLVMLRSPVESSLPPLGAIVSL